MGYLHISSGIHFDGDGCLVVLVYRRESFVDGFEVASSTLVDHNHSLTQLARKLLSAPSSLGSTLEGSMLFSHPLHPVFKVGHHFFSGLWKLLHSLGKTYK